MPITCPIRIPRIGTEEFRQLDYEVMKHAFASHKDLGRLADESIYQADLAARLVEAGHEVQREVPITASFGDFSKTYYMDMVVDRRVVYEIKTVSALAKEHEAQVLNYLLMVDSGQGKLINFRSGSVESRFINAPITHEERRTFVVEDRLWQGAAGTKDNIILLLRDWGTALELPIYYQAAIHLLGGELAVTRQLPMERDGIPLGNQRFQLMTPDSFFRITAFSEPTPSYQSGLRRLLACSPLKAAHWINIAHRNVAFTTVSKSTFQS